MILDILIRFKKILESLGNYRVIYGVSVITILIGLMLEASKPDKYGLMSYLIFIGLPIYVLTIIIILFESFMNIMSTDRSLFDKKVIGLYLICMFVFINFTAVFLMT